MDNQKAKLISPTGEICDMLYYEIGLYSEKICEEYISKSEENKKEFEDFSENYHYFKPYFDFMIFKLGYKIINPFLKEDTIGYAIGNYFITKSLRQKSRMEKYTSVNDHDLQITNYKEASIQEGFIDQNGIAYKVNRKIDMGHSKVCELVLNQLMIYNKEICDDFVYCINNTVIGQIEPVIENYMIERLGFTHMCIFDTGYGNVIYNDIVKLDWFEDFKKIYEQKYSDIHFLPISEEIDLELEPIHARKIG